ncbi:MAG: hypothetical protein J7K26_03320 [Candidatus Aenigmarchaeota archaeon]|nr:hypothetical protein [Candidatus Aenigmarchaeota archaeon]
MKTIGANIKKGSAFWTVFVIFVLILVAVVILYGASKYFGESGKLMNQIRGLVP